MCSIWVDLARNKTHAFTSRLDSRRSLIIAGFLFTAGSGGPNQIKSKSKETPSFVFRRAIIGKYTVPTRSYWNSIKLLIYSNTRIQIQNSCNNIENITTSDKSSWVILVSTGYLQYLPLKIFTTNFYVRKIIAKQQAFWLGFSISMFKHVVSSRLCYVNFQN